MQIGRSLTSGEPVGATRFGLSQYAANSLFGPGQHFAVHPYLPVCTDKTPPNEFADMLEKFLLHRLTSLEVGRAGGLYQKRCMESPPFLVKLVKHLQNDEEKLPNSKTFTLLGQPMI